MKPHNDPEPWEKVIYLIRAKAHKKGLSWEDVARQAGLMPSTVKRVLNFNYCPSLKVFLALAQVVGLEITDTDTDTD